MASAFKSPGNYIPGHPDAPESREYNPPPSRPLQIFLFCAFLLTAAAYIAGQRSDMTAEDAANRDRDAKLYRQTMAKTQSIAYTKLGFQAEEQKHYAAAVSNFQNATHKQNTGEAHYNLGNALVLAGQPNDALKEFQLALSMDPRLWDVYLSWGQTLMDQGRPDEAERIYRKAIAQSPSFSLHHFKLAVALAAQKKDAEALSEYDQAARLGLESPEFLVQYGTALNQASRFSDAAANLNKVAALKSNLPGLQFQLAKAQQQLGEYTNAISHYELVLAQNPDDAQTLNNLALIYATATNASVRNSRLAVQYASHLSTAATGQNPRYLDTLARSYAAGGDFSQATIWENKAIEMAKQASDEDLVRELSARYTLFQQQKAE